MCYIESIAERHAESWLDSASDYIFDQAYNEFVNLYEREPDHYNNYADSIKLQQLYSEIIFNYAEF